MTLWHLLSRVPTEDRGLVFDALATLVAPPGGVTRDGIRRGDRAMRDRWWDALDLGTSSWWRTWERQWRWAQQCRGAAVLRSTRRQSRP
jgi:hypothetical protein